ncbi:hypothetical protein JRO89_XS09G0055500 [Xanthoceras sorbifolium]|uniref:Reverse transcriptase zinc-binding domain-containing protein n=1 Tax=Xanthoceras sorbifolium TaxID=99658 RepID=A0ABQ8HKK7_9ROSI|nr:hypothetical protein JRO89_XS09G0055500 [Xanthoceras sorbifolium]
MFGPECSLQNIVDNLDVCSKALQEWNTVQKGALKCMIKVKKHEFQMANDVSNFDEWQVLNNIECELDNLLATEEKYWRQRSQVRWLQHGDRNTRYFHAKASSRRAKNLIPSLYNTDGNFGGSFEFMSNLVLHYFNEIFATSSPSSEHMQIIFGALKCKVTPAMNNLLDAAFHPYEIRIRMLKLDSGGWNVPLIRAGFDEQDCAFILSIPTCSNDTPDRHVPVDPICMLCGKHPETTTHALLGYPSLWQIRRAFPKLSGDIKVDSLKLIDALLFHKRVLYHSEFL